MSDPIFFKDIIKEFEDLYESAIPNVNGLDQQKFKEQLFSKILVDDTSRFPMGFVYMDGQTHVDFRNWLQKHHSEQEYLVPSS